MRYEPRLAAETRFGHLLATRPAAVVFSLALLHFLGLAFVILLTQPTLGLDVFEQVAWARDPQWAYAKHPPLPAWIIAAAISAAGNKPWIAAILGAATSAAALPIVWVLARRVVGASQALIAVFLLEGVIYFNFASVDFNHNVILLPLWALIAYAAHRAFIEGKLIDWALLGIAAALGMLGKYATALLLIAVLAAFLADREARAKLWGKGPLIAILCGTVLLAPHLLALYRIDFAPFTYAGERLKNATSIFDYLLFPAGWLGAQLLNAAPALCLAAFLLLGAKSPKLSLLPLETADACLKRNWQFFGILFAVPLLVCVAAQGFGRRPVSRHVGLSHVRAAGHCRGASHRRPAARARSHTQIRGRQPGVSRACDDGRRRGELGFVLCDTPRGENRIPCSGACKADWIGLGGAISVRADAVCCG